MTLNWTEFDLKLKEFEETLPVPAKDLSDVDSAVLKDITDLQKVPKSGGCYWIWTNEPIHHKFHNKKTPEDFEGGEVIYNGLSKDDIQGRIRRHLFGKLDEGLSAISIDLLPYVDVKSHRKAACSPTKNSTFFEGKRIREKSKVFNLHLCEEEIDFVTNSNSETFYFRNGINILEDKHRPFGSRVYFIANLKSATYGDLIEKKWRDKHNALPRLCTYSKGR